MKPSHHPNDEIVMRYAAATLSEGASVVIGVHMSVCEHCRARSQAFEVLGGAILDEIEPAPMMQDGYAKVLQRIDADEREMMPVPAGGGEIVPGLPVPEGLRKYRIGRWRNVAPGLKFSRISSPHSTQMNLFMLRAAPGSSLLEHGHTGDEYLCVLKGAFTDQDGHHQPGDVAIADAAIEHQPVVDTGDECICLVALEGNLRLRSLVGRLLQPVYGL